MEGQKFHTVQRVQVLKKRIQNAATCIGRGILMVSQPNLTQINTSVDTIAATTQACCPNRLQVLMIKSNRLNNNIHDDISTSISIKILSLRRPQHKHKQVRMRRMDNCRPLSSIPPPYSKTRWQTVLIAYAFISAFSLDISTSTRRTKRFVLLLLTLVRVLSTVCLCSALMLVMWVSSRYANACACAVCRS